MLVKFRQIVYSFKGNGERNVMNIKGILYLGVLTSTACIGMNQPQFFTSRTYKFRGEYSDGVAGGIRYERPIRQHQAAPNDEWNARITDAIIHRDTWWWLSIWFPGLTEEQVRGAGQGTTQMPNGFQIQKEADTVLVCGPGVDNHDIEVSLNERNRINSLTIYKNGVQVSRLLPLNFETPLGYFLVYPLDGLPTRLDTVAPFTGHRRIDKIGISVNCELSPRSRIGFSEPDDYVKPYTQLRYPMMSSYFLDRSVYSFRGLFVYEEMENWEENIFRQHIGGIFQRRFDRNIVNAEATRELYDIKNNYQGWIISVNYKKFDEQGNCITDVTKEIDDLYYYEPSGILHFDFYNRDEDEIREIEESGQDPYTGTPGDWAAKYPY